MRQDSIRYSQIANILLAISEYILYLIFMKPQDILVLLKLFLWKEEDWSIAKIADSIGISHSETHAAIKRSILAGLFDELTRRPRRAALEEFLIHGLKYTFPAEFGTLVRGMPTAHSGPPLDHLIVSAVEDVFVWPYEFGKARGISVKPLYRSVVVAAEKDIELYEYLVLIDGLRVGRVREQKIATDELISRIRGEGNG